MASIWQEQKDVMIQDDLTGLPTFRAMARCYEVV